jgi:hypothetical protein
MYAEIRVWEEKSMKRKERNPVGHDVVLYAPLGARPV